MCKLLFGPKYGMAGERKVRVQVRCCRCKVHVSVMSKFALSVTNVGAADVRDPKLDEKG